MEEQKQDSFVFVNRNTWQQKFHTYLQHPGSLLLLVLVGLSAFATLGLLLFLIAYILIKGVPHLTLDLFSWKYTTENVSMLPAVINTIFMTVISLLIAVPCGIGAAIYLAEYAKRGNTFVKVIRLMAETLSGIPSIVYGLFGMLCFVTTLGWNYSLLAGACTLSIMILPLILRTTEEALLSVPDAYREASFGLGAGKFRTILKIVLPAAVPGILAGVILAIGRIVGETAALLYTSGTVPEVAESLFDSAETLALHMWVLSGESLYTDQAYATAVVLLVVVVLINGLSAMIAGKIAKR